MNDFPGFSLLTRWKACEGFPGMQTLFFTPFLSFSVFFFLSLTLQAPQRTRRRKLNAVFQRDNLSSAEERVCKIPSHSASPWGDTNSFSPLSPLSHLLDGLWWWLTACTESFVWQIKKRMLTLDRLWHCVYQTPAVGEVDLNNISQSCLQSIRAHKHKQSPKESVILFCENKKSSNDT